MLSVSSYSGKRKNAEGAIEKLLETIHNQIILVLLKFFVYCFNDQYNPGRDEWIINYMTKKINLKIH